VRTCNNCSGRGIKVTLRQMGPMIQQIQSPCDDCSGTGEIINPKDRCTNCKGKKILPEKKFLEVHIDKGMKSGQTISFRGESDQAPNAEPGDVVIVIEEKKHERFRRGQEGLKGLKGIEGLIGIINDNDLVYVQEVDLLTALGGGHFAIKHLDQRALVVQIAPGEVIKHGDIKAIPNQGMPSQRHHEPGNLYVKLNVTFPDSIDPASIPLLERALPPRNPIEKFDKQVLLEEVSMEAPPEGHSRHRGDDMRDDSMDEDHDEPRVQCANQ